MNRLMLMIVLLAFCADARAALPEASPALLGFDPAKLAKLDGVIEKAIDRKVVPGAVVLVARHGKIAYVRSIGRRAIVPAEEAMTRDTVFDLASLTKPVATATCAMILVDRGKFGTGDLLGLFLLGLLSRAAGQGAAFLGMIAGLAAVSYAAFGTKLAYPWYALVGSTTVVAVGTVASLILPARSPSPSPSLESK